MTEGKVNVVEAAQKTVESGAFLHAFKHAIVDGVEYRFAPAGLAHRADNGVMADFYWKEVPLKGEEEQRVLKEGEFTIVEGSDTLEARLETLGFYSVAVDIPPQAFAVAVCVLHLLDNPELTFEDYLEVIKEDDAPLYMAIARGKRIAMEHITQNDPIAALAMMLGGGAGVVDEHCGNPDCAACNAAHGKPTIH